MINDVLLFSKSTHTHTYTQSYTHVPPFIGVSTLISRVSDRTSPLPIIEWQSARRMAEGESEHSTKPTPTDDHQHTVAVCEARPVQPPCLCHNPRHRPLPPLSLWRHCLSYCSPLYNLATFDLAFVRGTSTLISLLWLNF